jgi:hypothetical protein
MVKYQKRKQNENWMTVQQSQNHSSNIISSTLDSLERSYRDCQVRAIDDKNNLLEQR